MTGTHRPALASSTLRHTLPCWDHRVGAHNAHLCENTDICAFDSFGCREFFLYHLTS